MSSDPKGFQEKWCFLTSFGNKKEITCFLKSLYEILVINKTEDYKLGSKCTVSTAEFSLKCCGIVSLRFDIIKSVKWQLCDVIHAFLQDFYSVRFSTETLLSRLKSAI